MNPPVPTEELKARGTYRKARHGQRAKADGIRPECPADLQGEALAVWNSTVARLEAMRVIDQIDGVYLADYCHAAAELRAARQQRQQLQGQLDRLRKSRAKDAARQLASVQREIKQASIDYRAARDALYKAGDRLGIGPIGRARVKVETGQGPVPAGEKGKGRFFKPKVAEGT